MSAFTIDELAVPASVDAPDAADFIASVDVRNAIQAEEYGTSELAYAPAELLPTWQDRRYEPKRLLGVRIGGRIVARAVYETQSQDAGAAWLSAEVLPEFRGRGIGTALADHLERLAAADGRSKLIVYAASRLAPGERLTPPTGFGSVPAGNDEVRFLLARNYTLEQISRGSRLSLPVDDGELGVRYESAATASGPDYTVHFWMDRTPEPWREDMALLITQMSADAPTAGLDEPDDVWTVQRLIDEEEAQAASPRTELTVVVEHIPTGRLVGFTELSVPAEIDRPVAQEDTLVVRRHRGHRLGILLKVAGLVQLQRGRPGHPCVITFNAEENRHMLDVNEAIGFVPMGYEGAWKKIVE